MASLIAISRAESNRAKTLRQRRLWCHAGTFIFSASGMFLSEPWVQLSVMGAIVTEAGAWLFRQRASEHHALGEEARRLGMAMEGLGETHESSQAIDLRAKISEPLLRAATQLEDPNYYASVLPPGRQRLAQLLEQSSFWSKHLYRAAATESIWISAGVGGLLLIAALMAGVFTGAATLARAAVLLLGVLISVDEVGTALGWSSAADAASCVNALLEKIDVDREPLLMTLFADYSVATATAAPIPQHVYDRAQDHLNELWRQRRSG